MLRQCFQGIISQPLQGQCWMILFSAQEILSCQNHENRGLSLLSGQRYSSNCHSLSWHSMPFPSGNHGFGLLLLHMEDLSVQQWYQYWMKSCWQRLSTWSVSWLYSYCIFHTLLYHCSLSYGAVSVGMMFCLDMHHWRPRYTRNHTGWYHVYRLTRCPSTHAMSFAYDDPLIFTV